MPTPRRRAMRRLRRWLDWIWVAGSLAWIAFIIASQRPWHGLNEFQNAEWLLVGVGGIMVGVLQRRGKDYWPANALLGLACGVVPTLNFTLAELAFEGDTEAFRRWAIQAHLALWGWGTCIFLLLWAFYIVMRINHASKGSSVDLLGRTGKPSDEQIEEALSVIERALRHRLGNILTHPSYRALLKLIHDADNTTWFSDPRDQLKYEHVRAKRRIAEAEQRVVAELGQQALDEFEAKREGVA